MTLTSLLTLHVGVLPTVEGPGVSVVWILIEALVSGAAMGRIVPGVPIIAHAPVHALVLRVTSIVVLVPVHSLSVLPLGTTRILFVVFLVQSLWSGGPRWVSVGPRVSVLLSVLVPVGFSVSAKAVLPVVRTVPVLPIVIVLSRGSVWALVPVGLGLVPARPGLPELLPGAAVLPGRPSPGAPPLVRRLVRELPPGLVRRGWRVPAERRARTWTPPDKTTQESGSEGRQVNGDEKSCKSLAKRAN